MQLQKMIAFSLALLVASAYSAAIYSAPVSKSK